MTSFVSTIVALAMLALAVEGATTPAPAKVDCGAIVVNMAGCLPFVTDDNSTSSTEKPTEICCNGLKVVLDSNCLCEGLKMAPPDLGLNVKKALALPQACGLPSPSRAEIASCGVALPPADSPASTPSTPKAPSSPSTPKAPSSETGPSEKPPSSAPPEKGSSSSITVSVFLIIAGLFAAFFTSF